MSKTIPALDEQKLITRLISKDQHFTTLVRSIPEELYKHTGTANYSQEDNKDEEEETEGRFGKRLKPMTTEEKKKMSQERKKRKYAAESAKDDVKVSFLDDTTAPASSSGSTSTPAIEESTSVDGADKMEALKKRLQIRIEELKAKRLAKKDQKGEKPPQHKPATATTTNNATSKPKKANDDIDTMKYHMALSVGSNNNDSDESGDDESDNHTDEDTSMVTSEAGANIADLSGIEYSNVRGLQNNTNNHENTKAAQKLKRMNKVQRIKKLLTEAEKKRERLKQLKASENDVDKKKAISEQWNDALMSASGEKALLVSTSGTTVSSFRTEQKLKKALKRRGKKKEKSAQQWQTRLDKVEDDKKVRTQKREENILKRRSPHLAEAMAKENAAEEAALNPPKRRFNPKYANRDDDGGKPPHGAKNGRPKGNHQGSGNQATKNRAGFEGRKKDGGFLNSR